VKRVSRIRRLLLLHAPNRGRTWIYRAPFYVLTFIVLPVLSLAAVGAYLGPDETLAGVWSVLAIAGISLLLSKNARRVDTVFASSANVVARALTDGWPFALEEPPVRRYLPGQVMSVAGLCLLIVGFYGGGLAANGLIVALNAAGLGKDVIAFSDMLAEAFDGARPSNTMIIGVGLCVMVLSGGVSVLAFGMGQRLRRQGARMRARDGRKVVLHPGEGPVLLLRSFDDEELQDPRPLTIMQKRYEETLAHALKPLGPLITLGRPGENWGFSGAARIYVAHENWQRAIDYLLSHSAAVVILVGRTESLWWEIGRAFASVPRERLLLFFPLVSKPASNRSLFADFKEFVARWNVIGNRYRDMEAERRARYKLFRKKTSSYLGEALPENPGRAMFLDFLPDGSARVLRPLYGLMRNFMVDLIPWIRRLRFDVNLTLRPFIDKLYDLDNSGQDDRR